MRYYAFPNRLTVVHADRPSTIEERPGMSLQQYYVGQLFAGGVTDVEHAIRIAHQAVARMAELEGDTNHE